MLDAIVSVVDSVVDYVSGNAAIAIIIIAVLIVLLLAYLVADAKLPTNHILRNSLGVATFGCMATVDVILAVYNISRPGWMWFDIVIACFMIFYCLSSTVALVEELQARKAQDKALAEASVAAFFDEAVEHNEVRT